MFYNNSNNNGLFSYNHTSCSSYRNKESTTCETFLCERFLFKIRTLVSYNFHCCNILFLLYFALEASYPWWIRISFEAHTVSWLSVRWRAFTIAWPGVKGKYCSLFCSKIRNPAKAAFSHNGEESPLYLALKPQFLMRIIKRTSWCWQEEIRTAEERLAYMKNDIAIRCQPHYVDKF